MLIATDRDSGDCQKNYYRMVHMNRHLKQLIALLLIITTW